jgi:hypothetical protein
MTLGREIKAAGQLPKRRLKNRAKILTSAREAGKRDKNKANFP